MKKVTLLIVGFLVGTWAGIAGSAFNTGFGPNTTPMWTASSGEWILENEQLRGRDGLILFPVDLVPTRRVEATITSFTGEWVAVVGKYLNEKNWVEARITGDRVVLVARIEGLERTWDKLATVTFPASVILAFAKDRARILVNGVLILEAAEPAFESLGGSAGLAVRGQASFSQFHASSFLGPVLITSLGRSPGGLMVKVLAERAGLAHSYLEGAKPSDLQGFQTVIFVLGASSKGLGAAGISLDDEVARGRALVAEARRMGLEIIAMHIEGEPRRGVLSDVLITEFTPQADYVVVKADGNADGLFTVLCQTWGLPLRTITTTAEGADVLADLFGLWR